MDILNNQFNFIKSCINEKGQIIDKKLKSPLNFQYHYSSFILSSVLKSDNEYLNKVIEYYLSIPKERMKPSNEFNVIFLLLALENDNNNLLQKYKNEILKNIYHRDDEELYKLNNNFRTLRLVGLILEEKHTSRKNKIKIKKEIEWILNLQFDDGFFPDSNMQYRVEKNKGIPHLTYHTKITMCIGLSYLYTKDIRLKTSFFRALKVLLEISIDNYYFFYGRSTNALFGYGSLYLVFILAYKFSSNEYFLKKAQELFSFLQNYQHKDGHISINLNIEDNRRLGFDSYMYDIVYNAYSNALFLLGTKFLETLEFEKYKFKIDNFQTKIYKNSGFVVFNNKNFKYCLNFKGHQNSLKHKFDSRVSPFSILYFQKNNDNLLPAVSFYPQPILKLVENKFTFTWINQRIKNLYYKLLYKKYLPLLSGNNFYYIKNNNCYYPFEIIRFIKIYDTIILKFKTKNLKKNCFDKCVISIKLSENLEYKIFFYEKVDKMIYSYRDLKKENFKINFSEKFHKKSSIWMETSKELGILKFYTFVDLKKIKIFIKVNN